MTENPKLKTIDYYDKHAKDWTEARKQRAVFWRTELNKFQSLLPSGRVLEIGSGTGHDAEILIDMGYGYVGTDASQTFLLIAKKRNPKAIFIHKAVHELDETLGDFDGFWTAATLLHIPKIEIDSALKSIKARIKQGGIGFISLKKGDGEKTEPDTGRFFAYYQPEEFKGVLERNGFVVIESSEKESKKNTWLTFFVRT